MADRVEKSVIKMDRRIRQVMLETNEQIDRTRSVNQRVDSVLDVIEVKEQIADDMLIETKNIKNTYEVMDYFASPDVQNILKYVDAYLVEQIVKKVYTTYVIGNAHPIKSFSFDLVDEIVLFDKPAAFLYGNDENVGTIVIVSGLMNKNVLYECTFPLSMRNYLTVWIINGIHVNYEFSSFAAENIKTIRVNVVNTKIAGID